MSAASVASAEAVAALRATLADAHAAREAAELVYLDASCASRIAESAYDDALSAVRTADPLYDVVARAMTASDLLKQHFDFARQHYDHDEWCVSVDRFQADLKRRGFELVRRSR